MVWALSNCTVIVFLVSKSRYAIPLSTKHSNANHIYSGWSIFAGVAVMLLTIPLNTFLATKSKALQKIQMTNKDNRIKTMDEMLRYDSCSRCFDIIGHVLIFFKWYEGDQVICMGGLLLS